MSRADKYEKIERIGEGKKIKKKHENFKILCFFS